MVRLVAAVLKGLILLLLRIYKLAISPYLPRSCRFVPSCSDYFAEALREHGVLKGGYLGLRRLLRCHPWGGQGYDPVPPPRHHEPADH